MILIHVNKWSDSLIKHQTSMLQWDNLEMTFIRIRHMVRMIIFGWKVWCVKTFSRLINKSLQNGFVITFSDWPKGLMTEASRTKSATLSILYEKKIFRKEPLIKLSFFLFLAVKFQWLSLSISPIKIFES